MSGYRAPLAPHLARSRAILQARLLARKTGREDPAGRRGKPVPRWAGPLRRQSSARYAQGRDRSHNDLEPHDDAARRRRADVGARERARPSRAALPATSGAPGDPRSLPEYLVARRPAHRRSHDALDGRGPAALQPRPRRWGLLPADGHRARGDGGPAAGGPRGVADPHPVPLRGGGHRTRAAVHEPAHTQRPGPVRAPRDDAHVDGTVRGRGCPRGVRVLRRAGAPVRQ